MALGDKLSKLRKENNCTQEQLADVLGVSRQSANGKVILHIQKQINWSA